MQAMVTGLGGNILVLVD